MVPQKFYRVREPNKPATGQPWAQASLRSEKAAAAERWKAGSQGKPAVLGNTTVLSTNRESMESVKVLKVPWFLSSLYPRHKLE